MQAGDYAILSIGLDAPDTLTVRNEPYVMDMSAIPLAQSPTDAFGRALAYVPLDPINTTTSNIAAIAPDVPPYHWSVDFLKPIPSMQKISLSWWRFQKYMSGVQTYNIPVTSTPGTVGTIYENTLVTLIFYCKNRGPE